MIAAQDSWAQTRDINLAAALASFLDVEVTAEFPVIKHHDHETGDEYAVFRFKASPKVAEIMRLWADPDLLTKHPEHPVAYMFAFMHNRNRYLDVVKRGNVWHNVKKAGRTYYINKEAKPDA